MHGFGSNEGIVEVGVGAASVCGAGEHLGIGVRVSQAKASVA